MVEVLGSVWSVPVGGIDGEVPIAWGNLPPVERSVLELRLGGLPFPHGDPDGVWRYRHAVWRDGPTEMDHQAVRDFLDYEQVHGRAVTVDADPALSAWGTWASAPQRPPAGSCPIQCCSHVYDSGCGAPLLCHGTPSDAVGEILRRGVLWSSTKRTGRSAVELAAASTWGEPPDYFDYVMFANGRCTAPEAVAQTRLLGQDLTPADLGRGYQPAARLYFRWAVLAALPDVAFDGVHPIKIRTELPLADTLLAVVVPEGTLGHVPRQFAERVVVLPASELTPDEWATQATQAALQVAVP